MNTTELIERLHTLPEDAVVGYVVWDGSMRSFVRYTINAVAEDGTLVGEGPQTVAELVAGASPARDPWVPEPTTPTNPVDEENTEQ